MKLLQFIFKGMKLLQFIFNRNCNEYYMHSMEISIEKRMMRTKIRLFVHVLLTFSPTVILDSSKLKESADDNFKFDQNGRKLSKSVENTTGEGEIARYEQFLPFPHCFQKIYTTDA